MDEVIKTEQENTRMLNIEGGPTSDVEIDEDVPEEEREPMIESYLRHGEKKVLTSKTTGEKTEDDAASYEEALEKAGTGKFQYIVVLVGGLIILSSYVSVAAVAYILPAAQCDLQMDSVAKGRLLSIGFVGLIMSCHLWGFLSDTMGRRYIIMRCLLVDGLLYFVTSLTPYYSVILVLRLINGFVASGGVASIYAYVGEFLTDKNRTKALITAAMVGTFTYFLTPVYAWLIISGKWSFEIYPGLTYKPWRLYYAVSGIPSLICVVLIYFLPESPKYLLSKGQTAKSIEVLRSIHKINKKNENDVYLVKDIKINDNEKVAKLGDDTNKVVAFLRLMWNQTAPLFKEPHRLNIGLVCLSLYLTYISNGGMYLWLPETMNRLAIFQEETHNEHASFCEMVQYSRHVTATNLTDQLSRTNYYRSLTTPTADNQTTEETCTEDVDVQVYYTLGILGVIQTMNLGFMAFLSMKCNKKYILTGLTFLALSASVGVEYIQETNLAAYDACLLIIFTGAMIPILNSIVVELFPTNLRGMASCLALMSCRLGSVTTNIVAGALIDRNCRAFIWVFIIAMAVCLVTVIVMPTKPKERKVNKISTHV